MDVYELVEKLGGEIVRGRARVRMDGEYVILGQLNGDDMVFTEAGRKLAAGQSEVKPKKTGKAAKTGKSEAVVVESASINDILDEDTAVFAEEQGLT